MATRSERVVFSIAEVPVREAEPFQYQLRHTHCHVELRLERTSLDRLFGFEVEAFKWFDVVVCILWVLIRDFQVSFVVLLGEL